MKRSIGSDLINQYNNLAKGGTVQNLNELMQLYSRLKNFETTNPTTKEIVKRNLLKGQVDAITEVTIDAALLGNSLGLYTSFDDAVANLNLSGTKASPAEVKNYKEALFVNSDGTSIKPDQFVDIVLETEGDFVVNNELGMLANQMAGKMFPQELIVPMIKQAFEDRYKEAKYIYDPARPIGEKGKSRHSLSVIFDDPNMTEYVTDQINNQLVEVGYTLTNIHDENWQSDVAIGDLNETDPMIGYFQEGAEMASEAKGEARFFRGKRTQGENLKAAVLVPMFPNIARPADQVFQVMEVVEVIPEGTEKGYYELKPLIVDDKPMGFKISDEAKDYVDPDLTNQQINKKSIDELRQERENFNVINEVMTGLKEGKFR